jgi:hypothetical protein
MPQFGVRSYVLLSRPPLPPKGALDLHVLGTPPAFILSQDQTLQKKEFALTSVEHLTLWIAPTDQNDLFKTIQNELTLICTTQFLTNQWLIERDS